MSGITDPTEEYFKDGLWAWVTSAWVKLVATAGGLLKIQIGGQDADVTVKQTTPANLTPGTCGYVGAAWRKNPISFGYSKAANQAWENTALAAGTNAVAGAAVPDGEIWVLTQLSFVYIGTAPTRVRFEIFFDGVLHRIFAVESPATQLTHDRQGWWVLNVADYPRVVVTGATLNDDIFCYAAGFAVQINL